MTSELEMRFLPEPNRAGVMFYKLVYEGEDGFERALRPEQLPWRREARHGR